MKTPTIALALAVLLFLLSGCGFLSGLGKPAAPPVPEAPKIDVIQRAVDNTVAFIDEDDDIFCTGVATEGLLLTAHHCVADTTTVDEEEIKVLTYHVRYQGKKVKAILVSEWQEKDLAALQIVGARQKNDVPLAEAAPVLGQKLVWLGYPLGFELVMGTGIVANPKGLQGHLVVDGQFIPGHSGGPVFDGTGRLVGIIVSTMSHPLLGLLNVSYAVHYDDVKQLIESL